MFEVWAILEGNNEIESGVLLLRADNSTLALDSETPLLIRDLILPRDRALSLCVSLCPSDNKGDTLCLPQMYPNLILCCLKSVHQPILLSP